MIKSNWDNITKLHFCGIIEQKYINEMGRVLSGVNKDRWDRASSPNLRKMSNHFINDYIPGNNFTWDKKTGVLEFATMVPCTSDLPIIEFYELCKRICKQVDCFSYNKYGESDMIEYGDKLDKELMCRIPFYSYKDLYPVTLDFKANPYILEVGNRCNGKTYAFQALYETEIKKLLNNLYGKFGKSTKDILVVTILDNFDDQPDFFSEQIKEIKRYSDDIIITNYKASIQAQYKSIEICDKAFVVSNESLNSISVQNKITYAKTFGKEVVYLEGDPYGTSK